MLLNIASCVLEVGIQFRRQFTIGAVRGPVHDERWIQTHLLSHSIVASYTTSKYWDHHRSATSCTVKTEEILEIHRYSHSNIALIHDRILALSTMSSCVLSTRLLSVATGNAMGTALIG